MLMRAKTFSSFFEYLSPLCTIFQNPFLVMDPKKILKAPLAPIFINFEGERAQKKRVFLVKIFQKMPTNAFFGLFF